MRISRQLTALAILYLASVATLWYFLPPIQRWSGNSKALYTQFESSGDIVVKYSVAMTVNGNDGGFGQRYHSVAIYDVKTGETILDLAPNDGRLVSAKVFPEAGILLYHIPESQNGAADEEADPKTHAKIFHWKSRQTKDLDADLNAQDIAFSADEQWIATTGADQVILRKRTTKKEDVKCKLKADHVRLLHFSPDSRSLCVQQGERNSNIALFAVPSLAAVATLSSKDKQFLGDWSADKRFYAYIDENVCLFDTASGNQRWTWAPPDTAPPSRVLFGSNGELVGLWNPPRGSFRETAIVRIIAWEVETGRILWERSPKPGTELTRGFGNNEHSTGMILQESNGNAIFFTNLRGRVLGGPVAENDEEACIPIGLDGHRSVVGSIVLNKTDNFESIRPFCEKYLPIFKLPKHKRPSTMQFADLNTGRSVGSISNSGFAFQFTNDGSLITYEPQSLDVGDPGFKGSPFYVWDFPFRKPYAGIFTWSLAPLAPLFVLFAIRHFRRPHLPAPT